MLDPTPKDFDALKYWPMTKDPLASIKQYRPWMRWARWLNLTNIRSHFRYRKQRTDWIAKTNLEDYFDNADRTIERYKWEFLKLRKSWFIIPYHWEEFAKPDCKRVLDLGCGDGDVTQRVADFIAKEWEKTGQEHPIELVGIDLSPSRINNCKTLCKSPHPSITFRFEEGNAEDLSAYEDQYFDCTLNTGFFEVFNDERAVLMMKNMCRVTRKGIMFEDCIDLYPGGYPRENLGEYLKPFGFEVQDRAIQLTEPFTFFGSKDPQRVWSVLRDQVIWAQRI
jgi:SAM-dependent methyltransferase